MKIEYENLRLLVSLLCSRESTDARRPVLVDKKPASAGQGKRSGNAKPARRDK